MSVHQVHPRSTFQKQFRTRPLRQQKAKRNFPSSPCRCSAQRFRAEAPCRASVQRLRAELLCRGSVQRFCAAIHHFPQNSMYRGRETAGLQRFRAAIHLFKRKKLYRDSRIQENRSRCNDTPFSAGFLVSRTGNCHSTEVPCSDTPFSARFLVSRKGNCSRPKNKHPETPRHTTKNVCKNRERSRQTLFI